MTNFFTPVQIDTYYQRVFGAPASQDTLTYWEGRLNRTETNLSELFNSFFASPQYQSQVLPIINLYQGILNRLPDEDGLMYWSTELANGVSLREISKAFGESPELAADFAGLGGGSGSQPTDQFISTLYGRVLGREPDALGLSYWLSSGLGKTQLIDLFAQSTEAHLLYSEVSQLFSAIFAITGTTPTQSELLKIMEGGGWYKAFATWLIENDPIDNAVGVEGDVTLTPTLSFRAIVDGDVLVFEGSATGEITFTVNSAGVMTFIREGIVASETEPIYLTDFIETTQPIILAANAENISIESAQALINLVGDEYILLDEFSYSVLDTSIHANNLNFSATPFDGSLGVRLFSSEALVNLVITGSPLDDWIEGDAGDDNLDGGDGNNVLFGGAGFDTLIGGAGNDTLYGGADGDILVSGPGMDILEGGPGGDILLGVNMLGESFSDDDKLFVISRGEDHIPGWIDAPFTFLSDIIVGGEGTNTIWFKSTDPTPDSTDPPFSDSLYLTDGLLLAVSHAFNLRLGITREDTTALNVYFREPLDISPDAFPDIAPGLEVDEWTIVGNAGDNTLIASWWTINVIDAGPGNDTIEGGRLSDWIEGGDDNDRITGSLGADHIDLGGGSNTYVVYSPLPGGWMSEETLSDSNRESQDQVLNFTDDDYIELNLFDINYFDVGNNIQITLSGPELRDAIYQVDVDTTRELASFEDSGAMTDIEFVLTNLEVPEDLGSDAALIAEYAQSRTIVNLLGTPHDDLLVGGQNNDRLVGLDGEDLLVGGDGEDILDGGGGVDVLLGLGGDDVFVISSGVDHIGHSFSVEYDFIDGGSGNNTIWFVSTGLDPSMRDTLYLTDGMVVSDSQEFNLRVGVTAEDATNLNVILTGYGPGEFGVPIDPATLPSGWIQEWSVFGNAGDNFLFGSHNARNIIDGYNGNDIIIGGGAVDHLIGGAGDDQLAGYGGADVIDVGSGVDMVGFFVSVDGDDLRPEFASNSSHDFEDRITGMGSNDLILLSIVGAHDFDVARDVRIISGSPSSLNDLYTVDTNADRDTEGLNDIEAYIEGWHDVVGSDLGAQARTVVSLSGTVGNDVLVGGINDDWLEGDDGDDSLSGRDGNDSLKGGLGGDDLDGGVGEDDYNYASVTDSFVRTTGLPPEGYDTVYVTSGDSLRFGVAYTFTPTADAIIPMIASGFSAIPMTGTAFLNELTTAYDSSAAAKSLGLAAITYAINQYFIVMDLNNDNGISQDDQVVEIIATEDITLSWNGGGDFGAILIGSEPLTPT